MPPGAVLCLYTDGLVDRRGNGVGTDVGGLRRVLARVGREATAMTAREILDRVLAEMVGGAPVDDDVCLLVLTATRS